MQTELTIKNYRCFPDHRPARLIVGDGMTALLGVNNSGKSSLLKFFYELRGVFGLVTQPRGLRAILESNHSFVQMPSVMDLVEVFSDTNERDIQIDIRVMIPHGENPSSHVPVSIVITILRQAMQCRAEFHVADKKLSPGNVHTEDTTVSDEAFGRMDISHFYERCRQLSDTFYIPAFRNALSAQTQALYFDIQIGQEFISQWQQ